MSQIPVEAIVMVTLVLLWAIICLSTGKCCPACGRPESDCTCHWH